MEKYSNEIKYTVSINLPYRSPRGFYYEDRKDYEFDTLEKAVSFYNGFKRSNKARYADYDVTITKANNAFLKKNRVFEILLQDVKNPCNVFVNDVAHILE